MKPICVVGSLNIDVFVSADRFPRPGENVVASDFRIFTGGGKGANQAFALARLGAPVRLVGKTGDHFYGPDYVERLREVGVDCDGVSLVSTFPGIGLVAVNEAGENAIYVYPGANGEVDRAYVDAHAELIAAAPTLLLQLEIPLATNLHLATRFHDAGKTVILDPAPAVPLPDNLLQACTYLTPNRTELEILTGLPTSTDDELITAARKLQQSSGATVIAKAGSAGAWLIKADQIVHIPGYRVKVVDTTAAGDSFNAGFAYALGRGDDEVAAILYAHAVGALSTTALGAQNAMPDHATVESFIASQPRPKPVSLAATA